LSLAPLLDGEAVEAVGNLDEDVVPGGGADQPMEFRIHDAEADGVLDQLVALIDDRLERLGPFGHRRAGSIGGVRHAPESGSPQP
jgi:hypothetical protein